MSLRHINNLTYITSTAELVKLPEYLLRGVNCFYWGDTPAWELTAKSYHALQVALLRMVNGGRLGEQDAEAMMGRLVAAKIELLEIHPEAGEELARLKEAKTVEKLPVPPSLPF